VNASASGVMASSAVRNCAVGYCMVAVVGGVALDVDVVEDGGGR